MECNEVFSLSRSAMLGGKTGSDPDKKKMNRMLWNSPPVGSLQSSVPTSSGEERRQSDTGAGTEDRRRSTAVKYRRQLDEDDVVGSPVELCDAAVLKITDATTASVGSTSSPVQTEATAAVPPSTPPASVDTTETKDSPRRRWLELCHCQRELVAIKVFYFSFIGALGVVIAYAVIFLKQIGLSAFQIGIISGVRPIVGFVSAPIWGAIADRYNIRRVLMLVSMFAWLAFFSGLYFIPEPARRGSCPGWMSTVAGQKAGFDGGAASASTVAVSANGSTSGTIVDVGGLHQTSTNSSATTAMSVTAVSASATDNMAQTSISTVPLRSPSEQERLREDLEWLYEPNSAYHVFIIALAIIVGGELFQSPTTSMSDAATLQILGRDQLHKYGAQRAWGPVGWASSTLFTGAILNAHRHKEIVCGVELTFTDYHIVTYIFVCAFAVSLIAAIKINFVVSLLFSAYFQCNVRAQTKETKPRASNETGSGSRSETMTAAAAAEKDRNHNTMGVLRVFVNVRNGSWILTIFFIGFCNGLIWGFLFWHLENLGATQLMMGVSMVVDCVFEFAGYFVVDYVIKAAGHAGIMYIGLLGYAVRFVVYASIRNPWTVLPVETLQGVTFAFTWVSMSQYTAIAVPNVSLATVQGIVHGVYFGLGNGVGHLVGGVTVDAYGAVVTYYGSSVFVVAWLLVFVLCQKLSREPIDQFAYQDMDVNNDVTSASGIATSTETAYNR